MKTNDGEKNLKDIFTKTLDQRYAEFDKKNRRIYWASVAVVAAFVGGVFLLYWL